MKEGFESLGRVRAQGIALLLVTFVVGALAGIALERVRAARQPPLASPPPGIPGIGQPRPDMMPAMFRELDLTPEQSRQIRRILQDSRGAMDTILGEMLPRLNAVTDSVRGEIRALLTPEQAAALDDLMRRGRQRWQRQGGPQGPRGRGSPPQP